jgi:hypothetical protein
MSKIDRQLEEDRALRNSARAVFKKELAHVRRETRPGAIGERIANRVGAKAEAASDAALSFTEDHRKTVTAGVVAAVTGAVLWFARGPISDGVAALLGKRDKDAGDEWGELEAEEDQDE